MISIYLALGEAGEQPVDSHACHPHDQFDSLDAAAPALLAVWLLVALAVTGIGYYIEEVNKFEEGLSAIAASEMRTLSAKVAPDGDKEQQVLAEETKDFIRKHYLWIRVL